MTAIQKTIFKLMIPALAGLAISACSYTHYKDPAAAGGGAAPANNSGTANPADTTATSNTTGSGSGATTATFAQVNSQILQPKCLSCHSNGNSPNLSSYSSFATNTQWIAPGNASASAVYNAVQSGSMPQGGTPLTSAQLTLLSEWIQAGALNN